MKPARPPRSRTRQDAEGSPIDRSVSLDETAIRGSEFADEADAAAAAAAMAAAKLIPEVRRKANRSRNNTPSHNVTKSPPQRPQRDEEATLASISPAMRRNRAGNLSVPAAPQRRGGAPPPPQVRGPPPRSPCVSASPSPVPPTHNPHAHPPISPVVPVRKGASAPQRPIREESSTAESDRIASQKSPPLSRNSSNSEPAPHEYSGPVEQEEPVAGNDSVLQFSKYHQFLQVLLARDLVLLRSVVTTVNSADTDKVGPALVNVFAAHSSVENLVNTVIDMEIAQTTSQSTLFRGNSMAAKVLSSYAKIEGHTYLRKVMAQPMQYVIDSPPNWEVNPAKASKGDDLKKNISNVHRASKMFLNIITSSVDLYPGVLRRVCWKLSQEVQRLFPDATYTIIGGFIFLRFICPAIIAPDGYGILNEVPDASRRGLILISKVLQNLSNGVEFGQKEEYMLPLNPFITENIPMMHRFFDRLACKPVDSSLRHVQVELDEVEAWKVYCNVFYNKDNLDEVIVSVQKERNCFDAIPLLEEAIANIGPPDDKSVVMKGRTDDKKKDKNRKKYKR